MKIKEGARKVKDFVSENWKGIVVGSCAVVLGAAGAKYVVRCVKFKDVKSLPIPENWNLGKMTVFSEEPTGNVIGLVDIPRNELASFGEHVSKLNIDEKFDKVALLAAFTDKAIET